jgi:tetratricopeptide (TPR) repeat protein
MELAKVVIDSTAAMSPGDPAVVSLQWRIYRSVGDWKGVARIGEDMARHDTAAADTAFWQQLVAAYVSDSQPVKAQEAASRGSAKFPNNVTLWLSVAQLARTNGQLPQALEATNRILQIDPQNSPAALQKAQIYSELDQVDSMVVALRAAAAVGAPTETVAGMALSKANPWFRSWGADSAKTIEEGERILAVLAFSDSVSPTPQAALLIGVIQLQMGQKLLTDAREPRNCEMATKGRTYIANSQEILPRAGRDFPDQVGQLMQNVMSLGTYGDQLTKAICPGGR